MAPIRDIVEINIRRQQAGQARAEFGRTLFLGVPGARTITATTTEAEYLDIETQASVRVYTGTDAMGDDGYGETDRAMRAASAYFQQQPYPKNLVVAYWQAQGASSVLWGQKITDESSAVSAIQALSSSASAMRLGADTIAVEDFTSLTGSSDEARLTAAATELQTALRAGISALSTATVIYNTAANRFVVEAPVAAAAALNRFFTDAGATAELQGATAFGLATSASGVSADNRARLQRGFPAENLPGDALTRIKSVVNDFYFIVADQPIEGSVIESATDNDMIADWIGSIASWAATRPNMFIVGSSDTAMLATETTSNFAQFFASSYPRTVGIYDGSGDWKTMSLAARLSSVNFDGTASLINAKFRQMPGRLPDDLTTSQLQALDAKHVNRLVPRGSVAIFEEGWTFENPLGWIDSQYWADWFENALQTDVFNLLVASDRIPYTDDGVAVILDTIFSVCEQGVTNGGIAPGVAPDAMVNDIRQSTGNRTFDGNLDTGYLVYAPDVAEVSDTVRQRRQAPEIRIWVLGSGAINDIVLNVRLTE